MARVALCIREGRERGMPAAREDSMTRLASLDVMSSRRRRAIAIGLSGFLAGCAAMDSMPPEQLSALRAKAQACNEALPDITHHDVDRFGRVQAYAQGRRRTSSTGTSSTASRPGAVDDVGARPAPADARPHRTGQPGPRIRAVSPDPSSGPAGRRARAEAAPPCPVRARHALGPGHVGYTGSIRKYSQGGSGTPCAAPRSNRHRFGTQSPVKESA
jgi:hypothetical protein